MGAGDKPAQTLGIKVKEDIKSQEAFGKAAQQIKGLGGTLHITKFEDIEKVGNLAWQLAETTQKPVVIIVKTDVKPS